MLENLAFIQANGLETFVRRQNEVSLQPVRKAADGASGLLYSLRSNRQSSWDKTEKIELAPCGGFHKAEKTDG